MFGKDRQIASGVKPLIRCENKPTVTALRDVASGQVRFTEHVEGTIRHYLAEIKARAASVPFAAN